MKNRHFSSIRKTKHIKATFFCMKDRLDGGEMSVIDCLAKEMWADMLTEPLQGIMAFKKMRARLGANAVTTLLPLDH
jgi:hypothetical protein